MNVYDSAEWNDWADRVRGDLLPKLRDSGATLSIVPADDETDIKFAVELGLSIMLDKPIILMVPPGRRVPARLVRVADSIVEGDAADPDTQTRLISAMNAVLP